MNEIRLGTRASALARWQADWVAARLARLGHAVRLVPISTAGDRQQQGPIAALGAQGVFTKEIQRALLDGEIDLAVHSLKDLPTDPVPGLCLAAVPQRGPAGDCLVSRDAAPLADLPQAAVVGTGSVRRRAQLLHVRPDLKFVELRGNVDTRLAKLDDGQAAALVLAEAGLVRLQLAGRITQVLPRDVMLPAVGQGALGLETRADDEATRAAVAEVNHADTCAAVTAERDLLAALRGGCLAPVGAAAHVADGALHLEAAVLSPDGGQRLHAADAAAAGGAEQAAALGRRVADALLAQGAAALISASRSP